MRHAAVLHPTFQRSFTSNSLITNLMIVQIHLGTVHNHLGIFQIHQKNVLINIICDNLILNKIWFRIFTYQQLT